MDCSRGKGTQETANYLGTGGAAVSGTELECCTKLEKLQVLPVMHTCTLLNTLQ
jgi:hypothetical protein